MKDYILSFPDTLKGAEGIVMIMLIMVFVSAMITMIITKMIRIRMIYDYDVMMIIRMRMIG